MTFLVETKAGASFARNESWWLFQLSTQKLVILLVEMLVTLLVKTKAEAGDLSV